MWTKPFTSFAMLLSIASALWPATSSALTPCAMLPNPIFVAGSTAAGPLVSPIAQSLARDDMTKATLIWQLNNSCDGAQAVVRDTMTTGCASGACIKGTAWFWTFDPRDTQPTQCTLDPNGQKVDLAITDVAPTLCPGLSGIAPTGILDYPGPVSAYGLVNATMAGETAIQAEEAHFVYGQGKAAGVGPWQNDDVITLLLDTDAGQLLVGQQIQLPVARWHAKIMPDPDTMLTQLYMDPASGIGILPTTYVDAHRGQLKVLAFQAIKQRGAYFPDRKASSFDKQNVRDGHYPLWGYMHMILRADPMNPTKPLSAGGSRVAQLLLGMAPVAGKDTQLMQVQAGLVPQCAMKVGRSSDTAPLALLTMMDNPAPCHCWFEKNVSGGTLGCQMCPDGKTCATGTCRRFLCEDNK